MLQPPFFAKVPNAAGAVQRWTAAAIDFDGRKEKTTRRRLYIEAVELRVVEVWEGFFYDYFQQMIGFSELLSWRAVRYTLYCT